MRSINTRWLGRLAEVLPLEIDHRVANAARTVTDKLIGSSPRGRRAVNADPLVRVVEPLESRQYLTAVTLTGSSAATSFEVRLDSAGQNVEFYQNNPQLNNPTRIVPLSQLTTITVVGQSGHDTLTVDFSNGNPLPASGINFQAAASGLFGGNEVIIRGTNAGGDQLQLGSGGATFSSSSIGNASLSYTNTESVQMVDSGPIPDTMTVSGGTYLFDQDLGASDPNLNVTVGSGATLQFSKTQHLNSLNVQSGGLVQMLPKGGQVLELGALSDSGTLDLANNDMMVHNGSLPAITSLIAQGYDGATWSGTGITSSTAAADDRALGVVLNANSSGTTLVGSVDGQSAATTDVVVEYTCYGDTNLDGVVNFTDLSTLSQHDNQTGTDWQEGDFNYDGTTSFSDLLLVSQNYNRYSIGAPQSVPVDSSYTLSSSSYSPSDPSNTSATVARWDVSWGDGNYDSYDPSTFGQASHVYTNTGPVTLAVTAVFSDGYAWRAPLQPLAIGGTSEQAAAPIDPSTPTNYTIVLDPSTQDVIITPTPVGGSAMPPIEIPLASTPSLSIGGQARSLTVDFSEGNPLPIGGLSFGGNSVTVLGDSQADMVLTTSTGLVFQNDSMALPATIRYGSTATVQFVGSGTGDALYAISGQAILSPAATATPPSSADVMAGPQVFVNGSATVLLDGSQQLAGLEVGNEGTARIGEAGNSTLVTGSVTLASATPNQGGGVLDLANNSLVVQQGSLAALTAYLAAGSDGGQWDGLSTVPGGLAPAAIVSSVAQMQPANPDSVQISTIGTAGAPAPGTLNGQPIAAGDVWVSYVDQDAPQELTGEPINTTPGTPFSGELAEFFCDDPNASASIYNATIVWGDGHTSAGTVTAEGEGVFSIAGTNTYAAEGSYTATLTVQDQVSSSATATAAVDVSTLSASAQPISATQGQSFTAEVAAFTDANPKTTAGSYSANIDWGDGQSYAGTIAPDGQGGFTVSGMHTYTEAGEFDATVTIYDSNGVTAVYPEADVAGMSITPNPVSSTPGQPFTGTIADLQDTAADAPPTSSPT